MAQLVRSLAIGDTLGLSPPMIPVLMTNPRSGTPSGAGIDLIAILRRR